VVPNPDPEEPHADADFEPTPAVGDDVVSGGGGEDVVLGQTDTDADNHTNLAETADIQPAPDADSTAKQEEVPVLHYASRAVQSELQSLYGRLYGGQPVVGSEGRRL
jgi:hypothetical protein